MTPDKEVIAYCRIGERSSHTWFVLKYLLGYPNVRNYDGSWTEWGNLVRTPIESREASAKRFASREMTSARGGSGRPRLVRPNLLGRSCANT